MKSEDVLERVINPLLKVQHVFFRDKIDLIKSIIVLNCSDLILNIPQLFSSIVVTAYFFLTDI